MSIAILGPLTKDHTIIHGTSHTHIGSIPYYIGKALYVLGIPCKLFVTYAKQDETWVDKHLSGIPYISLYSPSTVSVTLEYDIHDTNKRKQNVKYIPHQITYSMLAPEIETYDTIVMGPLFYDDLDPLLFKQLAHKQIILGNFGMFNYVLNSVMTKQYPERAWKVLPYVDYLFLDSDEITFLADKETVEESVVFLQQRVKNIIVTHGSLGSTLYLEKNNVSIPAFPPEKTIDPTGAGDTYLAAFIAAQTRYNDTQHIGRFAAMAATSKIEHVGALDTNRETIEKRLLAY